MKTISSFFITSLILTSVACAQAPVFTTVSSTGKDIFAGVKKEAKGLEPETYLFKVSGTALTSTKISLPTELIHREVVALLPSVDDSVVVVTQRTVEQGDNPQLHSYDPESKKWSKLAEVNCPSFAKLKVEKHAVVFSCLETNAKGKEVQSQKRVSLNTVKLSQQSDPINLPKSKTQRNTLKAELLGDTFEWKELKVFAPNSKPKTFRP